MKKRAFSTGFVSTILICLMLLPLGWAQQPKPGGTLRVAWEADITINHTDMQVDALIDRLREAATEEAYLRAGYDFQRYVVENMLTTSISSYAHLQAARSYVKGYENLHGYKLRFETTWLDQ